jgi:hypothetical protein
MSAVPTLPCTPLPRLFWPAALFLATLLAVLLLLAPLSRTLDSGPINYNEGWNAYHQTTASHGKPLYGEVPKFVTNNYPPISFHLIALVSRFTGDVNQTGRWVAFLSMVLVAALCGAIVRHFTSSLPLAVFTALNTVIWLAFYKADRIGMNDPQMLATVFSLLGLYLYIRSPEKSGWLALSAICFVISIFTKHNLLGFPAAAGLHLLLQKRWKNLAVWGGTAVFGAVLMLAFAQWHDGPYFFAHFVAPRGMKGWLGTVTDYAWTFQLPLLLATVWALRKGVDSMRHILVLCLLLTNVVALGFAGRLGVDRNIFFDPMFSMVMIGALLFADIAPYAARMQRRGFLLGALLLAPSAGVAIEIPSILRTDWIHWRRSYVGELARESEFVIGMLRGQPGPALCENLLLCFQAGKPLLYEPFFIFNQLKVGRLREEEVVSLVESRKFRSIQMYVDRKERELVPGEREIFTAPVVDAILRNYRTEARAGDFLVLLPNDSIAVGK